MDHSPPESAGAPAPSWPRIDASLYPAFAAACTLGAALIFYRSMHAQTGGVWSAPLDDVFIHFDYARATARGYPFQWSEGNGYSSGNTSLSYPFALAVGYWLGFRDLVLMKWAAIVACVSVVGFLLAAGRLFDELSLGRWAKYLVPPAVLSLGALNWSLWSGMENAFHLGLWGVVLAFTLLWRRAAHDARSSRRLEWAAGVSGALLFATRPESVVCVAALGLYGALAVRAARGTRAGLVALLRVAVPGALAVVLQAVVNRVFTGEWSANGAIAKLTIQNPYMSRAEVWAEYLHFLKYVVLRNTQHHFADAVPWGWLVVVVALIPFADARARGAAAMLWGQAIGWLLLVSMNGQVRWQNERYTMAAVAWILVLAALGLAALIAPPSASHARARAGWAARVAAALLAIGIYRSHQSANFRDQVWFFGRASRNIRDQHLVAGRVLAKLAPRRVLVGDAGALLYASDRPGLDLIGLGGYHDLPFARAAVHGRGASLELIERMPREERPDMMAIYPSWWGSLPLYFGERLTGVAVAGNVICGGAEKVIYRANWKALDATGAPRTAPLARVVDELDVGDLVSERAHGYEFSRPSGGFVDYRVLVDPADRSRDLFDAGRVIAEGRSESMRLALPPGGGRLVARVAPAQRAVIRVDVGAQAIGRLVVEPGPGWREPSAAIPPGLPSPARVTLTAEVGEWTDFHLWVVTE